MNEIKRGPGVLVCVRRRVHLPPHAQIESQLRTDTIVVLEKCVDLLLAVTPERRIQQIVGNVASQRRDGDECARVRPCSALTQGIK